MLNITAMIARLIINGFLHVVRIRKDSNKEQRTARVHEAKTDMPVAVLTEVERNKFKEEATGKMYQLDPMTRVIMGV
jgi:hypothetical protein